MEIIVGKTAVFCFGVKRAVEGSIKELEDESKIYCLGELVHNKQVILDMQKRGIKFIDNINEVKNLNSKVIIRSHGVEKNVYEQAKQKGINLIDYTCPNVLKIHNAVEKYEENGFYIFLTGVQEHPEVIGTLSFCNGNGYLISEIEQTDNAINEFKKSNKNKLLLISQTTFHIDRFNEIKNKIEELIPENVKFIVENTICLSTKTRQDEVKELSKNVDCMIIIGGKNSSNTKKLFEIAKDNCENSIMIETKDEIQKEKIFGKIGIMAGASTPQESIDDVIKFINNIKKV